MEVLSLKILVFAPLIMSVFFLLPIFSGHEVIIRRIAKVFAGLHFLYSLLFFVFFDNSLPINFSSELTFFGSSWIEALGIKCAFGIDGISLVMIILTSLLVLMACLASKVIIKNKHSLYYSLIFLLETAVLGVFASTDMFLFFLFWELELVPMYFLISLWGDGSAKKSAMKFLLYTFAGSILMLCGFLMLYNFNYVSSARLSSDIFDLSLDLDACPLYLQIVASVLILFGFAVKLPIVPFHTWLPNAHTDAPAPVSMLLAGILLKMGAYGIVRFNMQELSDAFLIIVPYIALLALLNIVFAAIAAYHQSDIKKIVAYSSISSMGIVLLGLCSLNLIGITGAIILMVAHGIVSAGLFYIVGIIYQRTKTREITQLGGLATVMPRLAGFAVVLVFASVGLPSTLTFVGEFLAFFGAIWSSVLNNYLIQIVAILSIIVLVLSVCYTLRLLHNVFYGGISERWEKVNDVAVHEFSVLFTLTSVIILFGFMPMVITDTVLPFINLIVGAFGG